MNYDFIVGITVEYIPVLYPELYRENFRISCRFHIRFRGEHCTVSAVWRTAAIFISVMYRKRYCDVEHSVLGLLNHPPRLNMRTVAHMSF